jgi:hypothetical protein
MSRPRGAPADLPVGRAPQGRLARFAAPHLAVRQATAVGRSGAPHESPLRVDSGSVQRPSHATNLPFAGPTLGARDRNDFTGNDEEASCCRASVDGHVRRGRALPAAVRAVSVHGRYAAATRCSDEDRCVRDREHGTCTDASQDSRNSKASRAHPVALSNPSLRSDAADGLRDSSATRCVI